MTARAERVAEVRSLREQGMVQREIAEQLGLSKQYVSELLLDPDGSWVAARKRSYQGECRVCGGPTSGSEGRAQAPAVCGRCAPAFYSPVYQEERRGHGPTSHKVLAMLAARGELRYSEIRDTLGLTNGHTSVMLHRLRNYGLVERVGRGRYRFVGPPR